MRTPDHSDPRRSREVLQHGRDETSNPRAVRAGPLSALFDGIGLRDVRAGDLPLVERVYMAVRDDRFNVVPPLIDHVDVEHGPDSFRIRFRARNEHGSVAFAWSGDIEGTADGRITYRLDGQAERAFRYNKIGLLVHHPIPSHAARTFTATSADGSTCEGRFPLTVGPQAFRDGSLRGVFPPFRSLDIDLGPGSHLDIDFEGDDFEMEDERNWTEYSYKSYSGPLSRPWPIDASPGDRVQQSVTITHHGEGRASGSAGARVHLNPLATLRLPVLGFGVPPDGGRPTARQRELLKRLDPGFVAIDLHPRDEAFASEWLLGTQTARDLGCPLAAALYLGPEAAPDLQALERSLLRDPIDLAMVMLFADGRFGSLGMGTPVALLSEALPILRRLVPRVPIAVGSDRFLSEVIRTPPDVDGADAVTFGVCPSGHADEDWAIVRNLPAQGDAVRTLRAYLPDVPVIASPVTLQTRFGSWPRAPEKDGLPPQVDVRQMSLLGAAWTLGSLVQLAEAGAWRAGYYETVGWLGLIEREQGPQLPDRFPSRPGDIFPMFHVFADIADLKRRPLVATRVTGEVASLGFIGDDGGSVLVANLSPDRQDVAVGPIDAAVADVSVLDETNAEGAMRDPGARRSASHPVLGGEISLTLEAYAYARIDWPSQL